MFPIKTDNLLFRQTLSRAFYLSDGAYSGDFTTYNDGNNNYVWSKSLIDDWFIQDSRNGMYFPSYYIWRHGKEIWIFVRGHASLSDGATDLAADPLFMEGTYHRGFYEAGKNIWPKLVDILQKYQKDSSYVFIFTGHSYGGAVANILHKMAVYCFPNLKNRLYSFTFGAALSMGQKTAEDIADNTYSFINKYDPVPLLSTSNIDKITEYLLPIITLYHPEFLSKIIASSFYVLFKVISRGPNDDKIEKPIGHVYHLRNEIYQKNRKLKDYLTNNYNKQLALRVMVPDHYLKNYGKKLSSYKDAVLITKEFDPDVKEEVSKVNKIENKTMLDFINFDINYPPEKIIYPLFPDDFEF